MDPNALGQIYDQLLLPSWGAARFRQDPQPLATVAGPARLLGGWPVLELSELSPAASDDHKRVHLPGDVASVAAREEGMWLLEQAAAHLEANVARLRSAVPPLLLVAAARNEGDVDDEPPQLAATGFAYALAGVLHEDGPDPEREALLIAAGLSWQRPPQLVVRLRPGGKQVHPAVAQLAVRLRDALAAPITATAAVQPSSRGELDGT